MDLGTKGFIKGLAGITLGTFGIVLLTDSMQILGTTQGRIDILDAILNSYPADQAKEILDNVDNYLRRQ